MQSTVSGVILQPETSLTAADNYTCNMFTCTFLIQTNQLIPLKDFNHIQPVNTIHNLSKIQVQE